MGLLMGPGAPPGASPGVAPPGQAVHQPAGPVDDPYLVATATAGSGPAALLKASRELAARKHAEEQAQGDPWSG